MQITPTTFNMLYHVQELIILVHRRSKKPPLRVPIMLTVRLWSGSYMHVHGSLRGSYCSEYIPGLRSAGNESWFLIVVGWGTNTPHRRPRIHSESIDRPHEVMDQTEAAVDHGENKVVIMLLHACEKNHKTSKQGLKVHQPISPVPQGNWQVWSSVWPNYLILVTMNQVSSTWQVELKLKESFWIMGLTDVFGLYCFWLYL
jgi:hypothetical protein